MDHNERLTQLEDITQLHTQGMQDCQEEQETLRSLQSESAHSSQKTNAHQQFIDTQAITNCNLARTLEGLFDATKELQRLQSDLQPAPDTSEYTPSESHDSTQLQAHKSPVSSLFKADSKIRLISLI
eukprot:4108817-Amphidinium_carterae.1